MQQFTHYHHFRVSDNITIDLLHFDRKLWYRKDNDTYGSLTAQTAKDNGALEKYVKRETEEKLT